MTQPSKKPTKKVAAATGAGAGATLVVLLASQFGVEIDATTAAAIVTLFVALAAYLKRD